MHTFHCCFLGRAGTSLDTMYVLLLLETEIFYLYRQTKGSKCYVHFTDEQTEARVVNASWWRPSPPVQSGLLSPLVFIGDGTFSFVGWRRSICVLHQ